MVSLLFSYSHKDEEMRDRLEIQLATLKRQGFIQTWHDRRIGAGEDFVNEIDTHIENADIILLLVSPDFIASDYCYEIEMRRALERHEHGVALVIPVILRPCDWQSAPFGRLNAIPKDVRPISKHADLDEGYLDVAVALRKAAEKMDMETAHVRSQKLPTPEEATSSVPNTRANIRSSNLALPKTFSEREKDLFQNEAFEFFAIFFENSLFELSKRNEGIECDFRRVDANRFTAKMYKNGYTVCQCTVFIGGQDFFGGICYTDSISDSSNSMNESLRVGSDEHSMYLEGAGFGSFSANENGKLTKQGGAEHYWTMLIAPLRNGH